MKEHLIKTQVIHHKRTINKIYKDEEKAGLLNLHFVGVGQIHNGVLPAIALRLGFAF